MTIPRGFTRCDECQGGRIDSSCPTGRGPCPYTDPCPSCSGSGLLPTEKLREEATAAALTMWGRSFADTADAVLAKVAEHLGGRE